MKYVNVYETYQCYGGPEEGGWYFKAGELVGCHGPYEEVNVPLEHIKDGYEKPTNYNMGFGPHDGCAPDGEADDNYLMAGGSWGKSDLVFLVQDTKGEEYFPKERPYYC